ncbi:MAG: aldehyde dehydrogenase family protein, partial [Microthrixaceae bacterium]
MTVELHSLVDGRSAGGEGAGGWIERVDPARPSEVVGRVAALDASGTAEAVQAADRAFGIWAAMPHEQRAAVLLSAADAVAATADDLGPLLARELGKIAGDCAGEMGFAAAYLRYAVDAFERVAEPTEIDDDAGRLRIIKRPYGVCAAIVPWNAPLILSILKVAPALACGNTIVVKPSPLAPLAVTAALTTIAEHLPAGVLSVVHGDVEVGETLVGHPLVRKVAFTGGGTVAKAVATTAAQQVTPVVLELGGNDAALVLDDAPFDDEMYERLVWGTFLTSGQVCMAAKRLYVPAARVEEFTQGYVAAAERLLVMGDPLDPAVTIGPVASPAQMSNVESL